MLKSFNFVDDIDLCLCIIYTYLYLHIYKFFRLVADRFGISEDIVWNCVFEVALLLPLILTENARYKMAWTSWNRSLWKRFRQLHDFSGVIGAIDDSHIPIDALIESPENYINRKGFHSVILQGIYNYKLKFIDIFTGICGSVHNARVWCLSDIRTLIVQDENRYFQNQHHLLADSIYPLSNYMLTLSS